MLQYVAVLAAMILPHEQAGNSIPLFTHTVLLTSLSTILVVRIAFNPSSAFRSDEVGEADGRETFSLGRPPQSHALVKTLDMTFHRDCRF